MVINIKSTLLITRTLAVAANAQYCEAGYSRVYCCSLFISQVATIDRIIVYQF